MQAQRYCFVDPEGGALTIKMSVDQHVVAGGDFKIFEENSQIAPRDLWKMTAENGITSERTIKCVVSEINKKFMVWQILCCSSDPALFEGRISIQIYQKENECKMTSPAEWNMNDIPPCKLNNPKSLNGSMIFILKT